MFKSLEKLGCGVIMLYALLGMVGLWIAFSVLPYAFALVALFVTFVVMVVLFVVTTVLPYVVLALAVALVVASIVALVKRVLR